MKNSTKIRKWLCSREICSCQCPSNMWKSLRVGDSRHISWSLMTRNRYLLFCTMCISPFSFGQPRSVTYLARIVCLFHSSNPTLTWFELDLGCPSRGNKINSSRAWKGPFPCQILGDFKACAIILVRVPLSNRFQILTQTSSRPEYFSHNLITSS